MRDDIHHLVFIPNLVSNWLERAHDIEASLLEFMLDNVNILICQFTSYTERMGHRQRVFGSFEAFFGLKGLGRLGWIMTMMIT